MLVRSFCVRTATVGAATGGEVGVRNICPSKLGHSNSSDMIVFWKKKDVLKDVSLLFDGTLEVTRHILTGDFLWAMQNVHTWCLVVFVPSSSAAFDSLRQGCSMGPKGRRYD